MYTYSSSVNSTKITFGMLFKFTEKLNMQMKYIK